MKKIITIFLITIMFIPFMISAEEKCTIVSGNGQDIGSEIECGTEHFYVIENKEDSVRMLAKYNLGIGYEYNKITITEERYNEIMTLCGGYKCTKMFEESEFQGYSYVYDFERNDDSTVTYLVRKKMSYDEVKQSTDAIGAHGNSKDEPVYPEYGVIDDYYNLIYPFSEDSYEIPYGNKKFIDIKVNSESFNNDDSIYSLLSDYEKYLNDNSYNVLNVDMFSVKELDSIIYKLTDKKLPLEEWANEEWEQSDSNPNIYIVGNIKEYLPVGYEWIYGTTYWTKTTIPTYNNSGELVLYATADYAYFIATLGLLCNASGCTDAIGAGIRPVVEISKGGINYNLTTETNENGTLETTTEIKVGDTIVLNATPKKGYKLEKLIVTTESGTTIEVSGENIIENEDGTISINPEVFTMPLENVIVEAKWQIINPKTGIINYAVIVGLIGVFSFIAYYCLCVIDKKENMCL